MLSSPQAEAKAGIQNKFCIWVESQKILAESGEEEEEERNTVIQCVLIAGYHGRQLRLNFAGIGVNDRPACFLCIVCPHVKVGWPLFN